MRKSPQEIERQLGRQYMQMLKENTATTAIRQDCADIRNWMDLLGNYNKALVVNQNARGQGLLGAAS